MNSQTAYFHVQVSSPSHDAREVLELLKAQERVVFNEVNEVFTYIVSRPTLLTMRCTPHANLKPFIFPSHTPSSNSPSTTSPLFHHRSLLLSLPALPSPPPTLPLSRCPSPPLAAASSPI